VKEELGDTSITAIHQLNALLVLQKLVPQLDMSDPSQSALSSQIDSHQLSLLMKDSYELDRARLLCVSQPHATAFLSAIPISNMGLALSNEEWSVSVGLVIGAQLFDSPFPCNAGGYKGRCSMMMDVHGHHALRCKFSGDAKPRHNKIRDLLFKKLQDAYANPLLEPAHLLRDDGKKPGDVAIPDFSRAKTCAVNVFVTDPLQPKYVSKSAEIGSYACNNYSKSVKYPKYSKLIA